MGTTLEGSIRNARIFSKSTACVAGPVADPDFELRWGPGFGLLALSAFLPSVISSFFTQNKGGRGARSPWAPPLDPPLRSYVEGEQGTS